MSTKTLLVIVPDRISDILKKGEYPPRYYNPGEFFDEVHLLLTRNDQPDPELLQLTVGQAKLYLHNIPPPPFVQTLGWQSFLLKAWVKPGLKLAQQIQPNMIRVHGNYFNGYLGVQIKQHLGIPLVVSIHTEPDEMHRGITPWSQDWKSRLVYERRLVAFEEPTLRTADWVLPVYETARQYALRHGAKQVRVCYNMLNSDYLRKKKEYALHNPPRILCVNRQYRDKNPEQLIRAAARLGAELTLVGDGPYHEYLRSVAADCGVQDRIIFHKSIANDELCTLLPNYDVFATHSNAAEIGKTILEALLTGLPVIINKRAGKPVPELQGNWLQLVENTADGYYRALYDLFTDHGERQNLGQRAYNHAHKIYDPIQTEQIFVDIYQSVLAKDS